MNPIKAEVQLPDFPITRLPDYSSRVARFPFLHSHAQFVARGAHKPSQRAKATWHSICSSSLCSSFYCWERSKRDPMANQAILPSLTRYSYLRPVPELE